jgi:hypothetical protein
MNVKRSHIVGSGMMIIIESANKDLESVIEFLRREMISCGLKNGLCSEKTIKISQLLDIHLAKYQTLREPC